MRKLAVALLMAAAFAAGVRWGTFVIGGSDSYCYAHQAQRWAALQLQAVEPLALEAPWPDAPRTFAPAGHVPSSTVPGAIVPICPAGLSIAMAPFVALGGHDALFYVVPLFGALLVGATYVLGSRFGPGIGLVGAVLSASSPVFLYQVVQPMSDVPAAALWVTAAAAASGAKPRAPIIAAIAAGGAILMRPNLVPLGIPIGVFLLLRPERTWRERLRAAGLYATGAAAGCVAVAAVQQTYYGSPFSSGYGSLDALFAVEHIGPNARRYATWMTQTHTPAWLAALAAPFVLPGSLTLMLAAMVVLNVALYLPYLVFEEWWYLRFLLPSVPIVLVLAAAALSGAWHRLRALRGGALPLRTIGADPTLAIVLLAIVFLAQARDRSVFRLRALEARYARGGEFVAQRLPPNAIVITSWQSGSVRFYSGRRTLVWDALDGAWLDRAMAFVRARGLEPYLLFERWEEPAFRARFRDSPVAALDWPPAAEVATQVRIYRPDDRARYLRGDPVATEFAR